MFIKKQTYHFKRTILRTRRPLRRIGHARMARLGAATLILWSVFLPLASWLHLVSSYQLSAEAQTIVGNANSNLSAKFSYDQTNDVWQFNKDGRAVRAAQIAKQQGSNATDVAAALSQMQAQVGGGGKTDQSLYSVDLAAKAAEGMSFYDNQTSQSFTMKPLFKVGDGKMWQGRVVYPFSDGGQIVYTAKTNGIKEDIVLNKFIGDSLSFNYRLDLPSTLQARLQDDGSIGVFSADPALYSNITYSADADRAKVESARQSAAKTNLVFAIPAPILKDKTGQVATAAYSLRDNVLTVAANRLDTLKYPLSIDPSVVITSSSDFQTGNDEGMIDYATSGQTGRSDVAGGSLTAWQSTTALPVQKYLGAATAYNGFIYLVGGSGQGSATAVYYAAINPNGTLGAWNTTTSITHDRYYPNTTIYNGYMYIYGGTSTTASNPYNTVEYAPVNADGTIGSWQTSANTMSYGVCRNGYAQYNGYLYAVAGATTNAVQCPNVGAAVVNTVQFAPILANGDVGTWSTTTSVATARMSPVVATYNGYIYMEGGTPDGAVTYKDMQYAKINGDGTLGSWMNSNNDSAAGRYRHNMVAYKGYLYMTGGSPDSNMYYAKINANGSTDRWVTASAFSTNRYGAGFAVYNDRMYIFGGAQPSSQILNDTQYVSINPPGTLETPATATPLGASLPNITDAAAAVYNNCVYLVGGYTGSVYTTAVYYASIAADGTLGTWTQSANSLNIGVTRAGYTLSGNRLYLIGGYNGSGTDAVQYATLNSTGGCGTNAWTTNATNYVSAVWNQAATSYNGYLYSLGTAGGGGTNTHVNQATIAADGSVGAWTSNINNLLPAARTLGKMFGYAGYLYYVAGYDGANPAGNVYYSPIGANGAYGTWQSTTSLNTGRVDFDAAIYNGYIYVFGGDNNVSTNYATTEYAKINSDGSLGAWNYNTQMTVQQAHLSAVINDDKAYLISGTVNGTRSKNVYSIQINNGGSGTVKPWSSTTSATTAGYSSSAVVYNNNVYVIGGTDSGNTPVNSVQYAGLNDNGTLGSWNTTTSFSSARYGQTAVAQNGYLYVLGGTNGSSYFNDVQYAPINANGSLGGWNTTSNFTTARSNHTTFAFNGYVYVIGGALGGGVETTDVQYAPINANGSLGTWNTTANFATARWGHTSVVYNKFVYVIGGTDDTSNFNDVQYAPINANGSLGTWNTTANFATARWGHTSVVLNGFVYIIAGNTGASVDDVQYAPINANGSLGGWSTGTSISTARHAAASVINQGTLYEIGGIQGATRYNDVQYTTLSVVARKALYSKLIGLGTGVNVSSVGFNGLLSKESNITYKLADTNGVYATTNVGTPGAGAAGANACIGGTTQYVQLNISFDDSMSFTAGSGTTTASYLTDATVNYGYPSRPAPAKRLYGGKSFYDQSLLPLDTCGI